MKKETIYLILLILAYFLIAKAFVSQIGAIIHILFFPLTLLLFQFYLVGKVKTFLAGLIINFTSATIIAAILVLYVYARDGIVENFIELFYTLSILFVVALICWSVAFFIKKYL